MATGAHYPGRLHLLRTGVALPTMTIPYAPFVGAL